MCSSSNPNPNPNPNPSPSPTRASSVASTDLPASPYISLHRPYAYISLHRPCAYARLLRREQRVGRQGAAQHVELGQRLRHAVRRVAHLGRGRGRARVRLGVRGEE